MTEWKEGDWVLVPARIKSVDQQSCISIEVGVDVHVKSVLVHGATLHSPPIYLPPQEEPCFSMYVDKK